MENKTVNSVKKGNDFEKRSLEIIKRAIEEKSLGIKDDIIIREKPSYYSADRKKDIVFDLSIEVWPPNAKRYVLVYLIECKDYSSAIPVDDLEEFYMKVLQVAEGCSKPVFIANNAFQESAFNFADSKRMMLIRAGEGTDHTIILHKKNKNAVDFGPLNGFSSLNESAKYLCQLIDDAIDTAFRQSDKPLDLIAGLNLDFLAKKEIGDKTDQLLREINPKIFKEGTPLTASVLERYIETLGINIIKLSQNSKYLGNCDIKNMRLEINSSLVNTNRYLFVLAHELGHYELHKDLKIGQNLYDSFPDPAFNFRTNKYEFSNPKHWIEWQANYFATTLILPHFALKARLWFYQDEFCMRHDKLYLTDQPVNNDVALKIITRLANYFFVSKSTIIYRLKELLLLEEYSNLKSIGQIIDGNIDSFLDMSNEV